MKRKLIWVTAATSLLILPVGVVVLEGTTAPVADPMASSPVVDVPATGDATAASPVIAASTLPDTFAGQTDVPVFDEPRGFDPNDILNAPIEQLITGETFPLDPATGPIPQAPVRPELSGVSTGLPADGAPLALAELDIDSLLESEFFGGVESDPVESQPHAEDAAATSKSTDGTGLDTPGAATKPNGERIEVSLIRPQHEIVKSLDDVIVRTRTKGLKRAFVLVRVRQKGSLWWVQDEAVRQKATYFRSRARFGNAKTQDGVRFCIVVAFTREDEDVPEAGEALDELPTNYLLSQEFRVTLNR